MNELVFVRKVTRTGRHGGLLSCGNCGDVGFTKTEPTVYRCNGCGTVHDAVGASPEPTDA